MTQAMQAKPLPGVAWEDLPPMYRAEVKMLDERELCVKVNTFAHTGDAPTDAELFACPSWAAGGCRRAGALIACAFVDNLFQVGQGARLAAAARRRAGVRAERQERQRQEALAVWHAAQHCPMLRRS
jgi:hypothetical protein